MAGQREDAALQRAAEEGLAAVDENWVPSVEIL